MAYPTIQSLPPAPQRGDQDFTEKANAHVAALTPWTSDVNEAGEYIEQQAGAAEQSAQAASETLQTLNNQLAQAVDEATSEAQGYASNASGSAQASAESANDAAQAQAAAESIANFKGRYEDQSGPLAVPATVLYESGFWVLLNDLDDVAASVPSSENPDWQLAQGTVRVKTIPIGAPDWPCSLTYDTDGNLSVALYSQNNARFRETVSYTDGRVSAVLYEQSADSGTTWETIGTETLVYTNGRLTATNWTEGA